MNAGIFFFSFFRFFLVFSEQSADSVTTPFEIYVLGFDEQEKYLLWGL